MNWKMAVIGAAWDSGWRDTPLTLKRSHAEALRRKVNLVENQAMSALLMFLLLLAVNSPRSNIEFTNDKLDAVQKNVADGKAVLVDVRSQEEWSKGHLEGSIFLPVTSLQKHSYDSQKVEKTLPPKKDKKILYTFCVVGMRAKQAGIVLEREGYIVRALKPGYEELIKAGFKQAKDEGAR